MGLGVRLELLTSLGDGLILPSDPFSSSAGKISLLFSSLDRRNAEGSSMSWADFFSRPEDAMACFGAGGGDVSDGTNEMIGSSTSRIL